MSTPCNLDDHEGGPALRTLASARVLARGRPAIESWAWLIQPGAAGILAVLAVIVFEGLHRALTVGAMVIGHD